MYLSVEHGVVVGDPLTLGQGGFVLIVEADDFAFLQEESPWVQTASSSSEAGSEK